MSSILFYHAALDNLSNLAPLFLADEHSTATFLSDRSKVRYVAEAVISPNSNLSEHSVTGAKLFNCEGERLIGVVCDDMSLRRDPSKFVSEIGARILSRKRINELLSLKPNKSLRLIDKLSAEETK